MSRLDSSFIAAHKAGERSRGAVVASDAFFPFRDGIDEAAKAGVTAVIQPGGSVQDEQVDRRLQRTQHGHDLHRTPALQTLIFASGR